MFTLLKKEPLDITSNLGKYIFISFLAIFGLSVVSVAISNIIFGIDNFMNIVSFWAFIIGTPITAASAFVALLLAKKSLDLSESQNQQSQINNRLMRISIETEIIATVSLEVNRVRQYAKTVDKLHRQLIDEQRQIGRLLFKEGHTKQELNEAYSSYEDTKYRFSSLLATWDQYSLLNHSWDQKRSSHSKRIEYLVRFYNQSLESYGLETEPLPLPENYTFSEFKSVFFTILSNELEYKMAGSEIMSFYPNRGVFGLFTCPSSVVYEKRDQVPKGRLCELTEGVLNNFISSDTPYVHQPIDITDLLLPIFDLCFLDRHTLTTFLQQNFNVEEDSASRLVNMLMTKDILPFEIISPQFPTSDLADPEEDAYYDQLSHNETLVPNLSLGNHTTVVFSK